MKNDTLLLKCDLIHSCRHWYDSCDFYKYWR